MAVAVAADYATRDLTGCRISATTVDIADAAAGFDFAGGNLVRESIADSDVAAVVAAAAAAAESTRQLPDADAELACCSHVAGDDLVEFVECY